MVQLGGTIPVSIVDGWFIDELIRKSLANP